MGSTPAARRAGPSACGDCDGDEDRRDTREQARIPCVHVIDNRPQQRQRGERRAEP